MFASPWFGYRLHAAKHSHGARLQAQHRRSASYSPRVEELEDRTLLSFSPPTFYNTAPLPRGVAVGDFTGDGKLSIVTANGTPTNSVSVLLGNGDGTFQPPVNYAVGNDPESVAVGEFTGEGTLDIITTNTGSNSISMLLGNGDGTFRAGGTFATGTNPRTIAVGDFRGNGKLDIITGNTDFYTSNTVSILLGNGDGTFQPAVNYQTDLFCEDVAVGDFDGDGKLDFMVAEAVGHDVRRFRGNGDGTFQPGAIFPTQVAANSVAVGDFNCSGILDAVVGERFSSNIAILRGNGNGTFQAPRFVDARGGSTVKVLVGDFNGDGKLDILTVNDSNDTFSLLLGNGDFTFQTARTFSVAQGPGALPMSAAIGDFNGDNFPDVVVANQRFDEVAVLLNAPNAAVGLSVTADASNPAGSPLAVTVTALTEAGTVATGYVGTVHFTSTDPAANLPDNYTFTAADNGTHTFDVTFHSLGNRTLTVTDTAASSIRASTAVNVTPAMATTFLVTGYPSPTTAGDVGGFSVTAKDPSGNTVPSYRGTVHFSSSDSQATLQGDYTFRAADNGIHYFGAVLRTVGTQSIAAADVVVGSLVGEQTGIEVTPVRATTFLVSGYPSPTTAGDVGVFSVTAQDPSGNTVPSYRGTVHFSSSDSQATLQGDYTFTAADNGIHYFGAVLRTVGTQSIAAADVVVASLVGEQTAIEVTPALGPAPAPAPAPRPHTEEVPGFAAVTPLSAAAFSSGVPLPVSAAVSTSISVTAVSPYGIAATHYGGRVHFSSSDLLERLPQDRRFCAENAATHLFAADLDPASLEWLDAIDMVTTNMHGRR
jgi:hypothetical protein